MIRIVTTIFAGLFGLAFGSFLNVCLSRWPAGESVVKPGSHCRYCDHVLAWWENFPLLSWMVLRGRCRQCGTEIGWRYPLVEFAVGATWAYESWSGAYWPEEYFWHDSPCFLGFDPRFSLGRCPEAEFLALGFAIFSLMLIALAALDAEHLWLPDRIVLPGIILGVSWTLLCGRFEYIVHSRIYGHLGPQDPPLALGLTRCLIGIAVAAGLILLIRWLYKLIRKREGIGLGDAKLMALLAAWLGLPGALLAFVLGAVIGAMTALTLLAVPGARRSPGSWAATKLPLGTFLCIGGIVSSLWGEAIIRAYGVWAGF